MRRAVPALLLLLPLAALVGLGGHALLGGPTDDGRATDAPEDRLWIDLEDSAGVEEGEATAALHGPGLRGRAPLGPAPGSTDALATQSTDAPGEGVGFHGRVLDLAGRPAEGVVLVATGPGGTARFTTDADGAFATTLAPGRYRLVLRGPDGLGARLVRHLLVDGAAEDGIELRLPPPATLTVAVLRGKDGVPAVPVTLTARGFEDDPETTLRQTTGPAGTAVFADVPRAAYDVLAEVPDGPTMHRRQGVWRAESTLRLQIPEGVVLKGRVTDGPDGPGVENARILLRVAPPRGPGEVETRFTTGPDGRYEVMVPRGRLRRFEVEAAGYAPWPDPLDRRQRRRLYRSLLALRRAEPVTQDVALEGGSRLEGTVTDAAGQPLAGIRLLVRPRRAEPVEVETDAAGRYVAEALNPGRHEIAVATPGWFAEGRLLVEVKPGATPPRDLVLHGTRRVDGVVVNPDGEAVHGARVWVLPTSRAVRTARAAGRRLETFTGAGGRFTLADVPRALDVVLRAAHGGREAEPVTLRTARAVPARLRLALAATGTIEGRCLDLQTGARLDDVRIDVRPVGAPGGRGRRRIDVGKGGRFRIGRLIPGRWSLEPERRGYLEAEPLVVDVAGERTVTRELLLDPGLVFEGVVVSLAGTPLPKARLDVVGTVDGNRVRRRVAITDAEGRFRITGFRSGVYRMRVRRGGHRPVVVRDLAGGERDLRIALQPR